MRVADEVDSTPANSQAAIHHILHLARMVFSKEAGVASMLMLMFDRLCFMCDRTKWPAARADSNDSSAANTVPQTTWASSEEFDPGAVVEQPFKPRS